MRQPTNAHVAEMDVLSIGGSNGGSIASASGRKSVPHNMVAKVALVGGKREKMNRASGMNNRSAAYATKFGLPNIKASFR